MNGRYAALTKNSKRPVRVMVFGTFDRLHKGHEYFLREARKRGDFLVVVVARDRTVREVKSRAPSEDEDTRRMKVEMAGIADRVMLGSLGDKYDVIRKEKPDVICLGYDQHSFTGGLGDTLKSAGISAKIERIDARKPEKYKTSLMKK
ncbi:MAG: adenylyltransferase/cytidyltransferase family protein [Candidatus Aenigmarchaeota archaeon]|nr:adenylyltransferase/cytidyltransferase family protein [Candidatus Aenigmarchaeota archaeon]